MLCWILVDVVRHQCRLFWQVKELAVLQRHPWIVELSYFATASVLLYQVHPTQKKRQKSDLILPSDIIIILFLFLILSRIGCYFYLPVQFCDSVQAIQWHWSNWVLYGGFITFQGIGMHWYIWGHHKSTHNAMAAKSNAIIWNSRSIASCVT